LAIVLLLVSNLFQLAASRSGNLSLRRIGIVLLITSTAVFVVGLAVWAAEWNCRRRSRRRGNGSPGALPHED
jgi:hypothetical protein